CTLSGQPISPGAGVKAATVEWGRHLLYPCRPVFRAVRLHAESALAVRAAPSEAMHLSDFHFDLPDELIARHPASERTASRLLVLDGASGRHEHRRFTDLLEYLRPQDLLVFNNTRVLPARLFGQKLSGGRIEMLVERVLDAQRVLAHVRASKAPKP